MCDNIMSAFVVCRLMRVVRVLYVYIQWEENVEHLA